MSAIELLKLSSQGNVARMLERDDFEKRYESGVSITINEFLYPLIQAYDSAELKSDIEFGGTDQKFNILLGRDVQRHYGIEPQIAILLPILEGLDGVRKMSKSLNNYVALEESAVQMFGKLMSLSDDLMWRYYLLLTDRTDQEIEELKGGHPMDAKKALAQDITTWLKGEEAATSARADFETKFSQREFPKDAREAIFERGGGKTLLDIVTESSERLKSRAEAKRLILQGGVTVDGEKSTDIKNAVSDEGPIELKIGKKEFVLVKFN